MAVFGNDVVKVVGKYEHRPIVTGNFLRQPVIKHYDYEIQGGSERVFEDEGFLVADQCGCSLPNADYIHDHAVMVGNRHTRVEWA